MYRIHLLEDYCVRNFSATWPHLSREKWVFISLIKKFDSDLKQQFIVCKCSCNLLFIQTPLIKRDYFKSQAMHVKDSVDQ